MLPAAALEHPEPGRRRLAWVPFAMMGAAGLVLESLAPGLAPRVALFLLSPIAVWKGGAESRLDRLPWIGALFGLLTLLIWALPSWTPTGEVVTVETAWSKAILPGRVWAPEVIRPLDHRRRRYWPGFSCRSGAQWLETAGAEPGALGGFAGGGSSAGPGGCLCPGRSFSGRCGVGRGAALALTAGAERDYADGGWRVTATGSVRGRACGWRGRGIGAGVRDASARLLADAGGRAVPAGSGLD